jgi:hypothetical protein
LNIACRSYSSSGTFFEWIFDVNVRAWRVPDVATIGDFPSVMVPSWRRVRQGKPGRSIDEVGAAELEADRLPATGRPLWVVNGVSAAVGVSEGASAP